MLNKEYLKPNKFKIATFVLFALIAIWWMKDWIITGQWNLVFPFESFFSLDLGIYLSMFIHGTFWFPLVVVTSLLSPQLALLGIILTPLHWYSAACQLDFLYKKISEQK